uniref:Acireductone dioxygenase n=1 Tax=Acrobeloides nanus TaxID=290746 RepID=A0A914DNY9_9BILA
MTDDFKDPREPCHRDPPEYVSLENLAHHGVLYYHIPVAQYEVELNKFATNNGYDYNDKITISRDKLPNYEEKIKNFFEEHLHTDDEVRYIVDGRGYFDVRSKDDVWIRILSEPGDLLILPAGVYHRFILTNEDYIHVVRLFKGVPVWTPHNRSEETDKMLERQEYLHKFISV